MALDKLVDSAQLDSDLASVANAIRAKSGGTGQLAFPAGFVSEIGNISGGGSQTENMETGSFVAVAPLDAVTIPVTSRRSHVVIWLDGLTSQTDLTDKPYGTNVLTFWYGDGNTGFTAQGQINYAGTSFSGAFQIIGAGGTQNLCRFTDTNIVISKMRVNGSNRPMVSGATYNWEAW